MEQLEGKLDAQAFGTLRRLVGEGCLGGGAGDCVQRGSSDARPA
jgi:hypothetical protein